MPDATDLPVVVALGVVAPRPGEPGPAAGTAGSSRNRPTADLAQAQGAIVRADALVDNDFLARTPRLRVRRPDRGRRGDGSTWTPQPPVVSPW